MDEELGRLYSRWQAADDTDREDEADAAFMGLSEALMPERAVSLEFTARTTEAIANAMVVDARRARRARKAFVWGGVTALTRNGALYFGRLDDGIYISIGCNGAGMLKGSMFGKLMGEMACGHQSTELADALGFQRPTWLPPDPIRRVAVLSAIQYQKHRAGLER